MSDPRETSRQIVLGGLSHHTAPLEVRERVVFRPEECGPALRRILGEGGLHEAALISTCNRTELVAVADSAADRPLSAFHRILEARAGGDVGAFLYGHHGAGAVEHLFGVAASLDSMVVGEAQILGQVGEAYEVALEAEATGPILDRLFDRARSAAKRVRTETGVGQFHVSVASVAVELAEKIFSSLAGCSALVAGAGETGALTMAHLAAAGIRRAYVTNRTGEKAARIAGELGVTQVPFERRFDLLAEVDVLVSTTSSDTAIFTRREVAGAMSRRRHRPIFLIDLAVPRDIDPECADIDGVFLYNIDDLQQVVERNVGERLKEMEQGRLIVAREAARFMAWFETRHTVPTVVALRRHVEGLQKAEEERLFSRLRNLTPADRTAVQAYGAALVNKILHRPTVRLKDSSDPRETARLIEAARELFGLDEGSGTDTGGGPEEAGGAGAPGGRVRDENGGSGGGSP